MKKISRSQLRKIVMAEAGRWMSTPKQRQPRVFNPPPAEPGYGQIHYPSSGEEAEEEGAEAYYRGPGPYSDVGTHHFGEIGRSHRGVAPEAGDALQPSQRPGLDIDMSTLLDEVPPVEEPDPYGLSDVDDENTPGYDGPINEKKEKAKKSDYWYQGSLRKDYKHDDEWFNIGGFLYDDEDEDTEY